MGANQALSEGQTLIVPTGVMKATHNARTFAPYDPTETLGETAPTTPVQPKPKKNKCGGLGQILLVVIAVVVAVVVTAGAAAAMTGNTFGSMMSAVMQGSLVGAGGTAAAGGAVVGVGTGVAAGAIGGAAGSIVSQGIGVATGIQDKFSWNAVALAALGGGIGGSGSNLGVGGKSWVAAGLRGMVANAATQGIGVALGLQKNFSWAAVAAAGVAGGVGKHLTDRFNIAPLYGEGARVTAGNIAAHTAVGAARAIAAGAARSLIEGSNFGDNVLAALPDVIGQTIGEAIAGGISSEIEEARLRREQEWQEAEGDALSPQAIDLLVARDGQTTTLEPGSANGRIPTPNTPEWLRWLGRVTLVGVVLNDLPEWGRTLFAHKERIPIRHNGEETGLRIIDGHGEFDRVQQLVDGEWRTLDVEVGRNVVTYEVDGADITEGRYVVDGEQLARAYIGEVDPDLTSYYRQQFVDRNGSVYRPGYVDVEVPVADLQWDFRDYITAIDARERPDAYYQLGRLSDTLGAHYGQPGLPYHSGEIGRSWTWAADLSLSLNSGVDVKQRYGLPDGLLPAPGNAPWTNDAGYVTFGLVRREDFTRYVDPLRWRALPWPNMPGVPNRVLGGGPEVVFLPRAPVANIVRGRVTLPTALVTNGAGG